MVIFQGIMELNLELSNNYTNKYDALQSLVNYLQLPSFRELSIFSYPRAYEVQVLLGF